MPLILPRRSLLSYPAGTAPGVDRSHPAAENLWLSAVPGAAGKYINLVTGLPCINVVPANTTAVTPSIDGRIGPAIAFSSTTCPTFGVDIVGSAADVHISTGITFGAIFRAPSANPNFCTLVGSTISAGNAWGCELYLNSSNEVVLAFPSSAHSGFTVTTGHHYFVGCSTDGVSGNLVYFVVRDLDTGQVFTAAATQSFQNGYNLRYFLIGLDGADGANMTGPLSAGMASASCINPLQLLQWAADPWSFWYPPAPPAQRKVSYSYNYGPAADTTTSGGARVQQRFNRSKLAYPAGSLPGFDPGHVAAGACGINNISASAVCLDGNLVDVLRGIKGTITTGAGAFTPNISPMGSALQFGSGTTNTNLVSIPRRGPTITVATGNAILAGIIRLPTGAETGTSFILGEYDANGGPELAINASTSQLTYFDASGVNGAIFDYSPIFGHPAFIAISVWQTALNWVVCSLQTGQTFSGTISIANPAGSVQSSTTVNFGNRASNPNLPFVGGSIAAGMSSASPLNQLSVRQLQQWSADPWSFWYPNKTINLTANAPAVSGDGTGTLTGAAGVGTAGTLRGAVDKALAQVVGIGLAGTLSGAVDKSLAQAAGIGTVGSITGADLIGVTQVTGTGVARALTPSVSGFITGAIGTGLAGALTPTDSLGLTGVTGTGVANTGIVPTVAVTLAPASGIGRAGTFSFDGAGSGNLTSAVGIGTAGTITASVLASISQAVGIGIAGSISGSDPFGITGVAGTGVARGITGSVAFTLGAAQGIGTAGSLTVTGANQSGSLTGVSGTGTAGTIIGFSSTASVALPGGNGGSVRPKKPTDFVPIPRKGGYQEPKLEDRVVVRKPAPKPAPRPLKFSEPVEAELPPVLEDILRAVLTPEPVRFESDEDAIAFALKAYLEREDQVRDSIRAAASEIIESIIQDVIDDLETETA